MSKYVTLPAIGGSIFEEYSLIYTNLLIFLVAIFLFSMDTAAESPMLPGWSALIVFSLLLAGFDQIVRYVFRQRDTFTSAGYFRAEKKLMILALVFFLATLYLCDAKYYLAVLSFGNRLPAFVNISGLALFLLYLAVMWRVGRINYRHVFGRGYTAIGFIAANTKINLPIVLPWVILSLLSDLAAMTPVPSLQALLASDWGDLLFFVIFLFFLMLFFPPLVRRLWGCKELPDGSLKQHLIRFCAKQGFSARLYLWPLFEGQALTAAVMGFVPRLRYILLTPAIIETMSIAELEAIMAHEIGHVKKGHLFLYVLLISGFSILAGLLVEPFMYLIFSSESFYAFLAKGQVSPETVLSLVGAVPLMVFMLVYFRYIFGYFIRNFERQADLHVFSVLGSSQSLVSAFEKIAGFSGDIRDKPNWHHFGIGERVEYLQRCERDSAYIDRHNRKVRLSLLCYVAVLLLGAVLVRQFPTEHLASKYEDKYIEAVLLGKARQEPEKALWQRLLGDLMVSRKMERKAFEAYQHAFALEPANPEVMNNLAWLLLTSRDVSLRDPVRALTLARAAAVVETKGHILDTLAVAYWANGFIEEAIASEERAILADPGQRRYYLMQIARFTHRKYEDTLREAPAVKGPEANVK